MSISLDKLKALRRQAGQVVATPATDKPAAAAPATVRDAAAGDTAAGVPANPPAAPARETSVFGWVEQIRHKPAEPAPPVQPVTTAPVRRVADGAALRRLLGSRNRAIAEVRSPARSGPVDRELPGTEVAPGLHLIEAFLPQPIPRQPLSLAFSKRPEEHVAPADLLFFDTETTGLAGGTGTRAFMIGAADWHHDPARGEGLRVRQLLMATMAAENAMLELFASWLAPTTVLSSYNGRCYDAPLLKTRYRLARRAEPLSALDHVDLLFPTRRRYRGTWENCRLATIERQLLRIAREDDLPGSEAPAAWLGYLRGGSARNLRRVGEHNHQDVVTLAQLFLRLVEEQKNDDERLALGITGEALVG